MTKPTKPKYKPRLIEGVTVTPRQKWSADYARLVRATMLGPSWENPTDFDGRRAKIERLAAAWARWAAQRDGISLKGATDSHCCWHAVRSWTALRQGSNDKPWQRPYVDGKDHNHAIKVASDAPGSGGYEWRWRPCAEVGCSVPRSQWAYAHKAEFRVRSVVFTSSDGEIARIEIPGWDQNRDEAVGVVCNGRLHGTSWNDDLYNAPDADPDNEIRHDMHGYYACTADEAAHEDNGHASAGFDGRPHYDTIEDALGAQA
jgi:hypothetical protein